MSNLIIITQGVLLNVICIWTIRILLKDKSHISWQQHLQYMSGLPLGLGLSLLLFPITISNVILLSVMAGALGELLTLFFLTVKHAYKKETVITYYDDGSPVKYYITGDKHRRFDKVKQFCHGMNTRRKDVLIILGDTGFNYYDDKRDDELKKEISQLNITLFCLHGNKENRPQNVGTYGIRSFCGGKVYYEPRYPNIYFAMDGEIYTFEGRKYMVVGGAHSVDKMRCLEKGFPFWHDEMPDDKIKMAVEVKLNGEDNKIYGMMTHTCPMQYLPTEMFVSTRQRASIKRKARKATSKKLFNPDIDRSTEAWLGELEKNLNYTVWFCGHYHIDKQIDKIRMIYNDIAPLHMTLIDDDGISC